MATRIEQLGSLVSESTRQFVGKRAQATRQYADMLAEFGRGKLEVQEFASKTIGLIASEAVSSAGDAIDAATGYWKGLARLLDNEASKESGATTQRATKKTAAKKSSAK